MKTQYSFEIQAIQKQNIILKDNLYKIHRISKGNGTNRVRLQTRTSLALQTLEVPRISASYIPWVGRQYD
jgi:hypothetical protein